MAAAPAPLEQAGQSIAGRYIVEEVLGRGGMAAVYRVLDTKTSRRCALKRSWARDPASAARRAVLLEREYYTLAQLAHPRIIHVYDYGVDERGPYYTMELLDGADLDSLGRQPWQKACAILRDVASSLAILHSRGLLHRDLSARNVRCDSVGRAKLIDFGALSSVGLSREVIGTPPFVAPEVLQMQALDSRADLYSLGALAYLLLTGRHAYPARRIQELRDLWRSHPAAPDRIVPEIPPALSSLVMRLLALDRGARPQSAAEIMKRLCTIAGLPVDEDVAESQAFLATPTLVGRDAALVTARRQMLSLARGDGGTLLIEGVAGAGRSRMLDACVLEGKLLGGTVVRAGGGAVVTDEWAIARSLCRQLNEHLPREVAESGLLSRNVLGHIVESLRRSDDAPLPDRSLLIRELRDFVLSLTAAARLVIVIDDIERIDEPSLAWLAALAHKAERKPILLIASTDSDTRHSAAVPLRLLRSIAQVLPIDNLHEDQTEALMRSLFGDVPNLKVLAARVHALSQGNARASMELAHHVVDRGIARYEAGSWSLPPTLSERVLPNTLAASLEARLQALSEDARELCDVTCVAEGYAISSSHYRELTLGWEQERVFRALHELVRARVLVVEAEHYRFSHRGLSDVARDLISNERKRAIHSRMADSLAIVTSDSLRRAHHLLEAGRDLDAISVLSGMDLRIRHASPDLLTRAVERAEHHGLPARTIEELRMGVTIAAVFALDVRGFKRVVRPVLACLIRDSGLARYYELSHLPASERLRQALAETQQSYLDTPEHDRSFSVAEAIPKLARLSNAYAMIGIWSVDLTFIESFPSLVPLEALSPAVAVTESLLTAAKHWVSGRFRHATAIYEQVLTRLDEADRAGLDETQLNLLRMSCHVLLGTIRAPAGIASAEDNAQALEHDRAFRPTTWRIRQLFAFSQGNVDEAHRCMRRAELLQLQDGLEQQVTAGTSAVQVISCVRGEDLLGLRNAIDSLSAMLEDVPNLAPTAIYGRAMYRSLQGDYQGALDLILPAFELTPVGRHWSFVLIAASHVRLLTALGRVDEAIVHGREYVALIEREGLVDGPGTGAALGLALASTGRHEEGLVLIERLIAGYERNGITGIALGAAHEAAARVSLWMQDSQRFDHFAERCAREYKKGNSHVLRSKLARLIEEAHPQERGSLVPELLLELVVEAPPQTEYESVHSRMRECVDGFDRGRCALTLLLQQSERAGGALYAVDGEQVRLMCALPDAPADCLDVWINSYVRAEISPDPVTTAITLDEPIGAALESTTTDEGSQTDDAGIAGAGGGARFAAPDGSVYEAVSLITNEPDGDRLVAVLALKIAEGPRTLPNKELLREIAVMLLSHHDASGIMVGRP
jgi:tetratricopeptide (TPR) repeat protein